MINELHFPAGQLDPAEKDATSTPYEANAVSRYLRAGFWLLAVILGFIHAWADHYVMKDVDGLSYLDMGDAYLRGDWKMAVNSYWSPLYSWLLGGALTVIKPSPYWELSVVRLVNLGIYLGALACFDFFLRALTRYHSRQMAGLTGAGHIIMPGWAFLALGYPLFIWSSLYLINIRTETPDMCLAAFVYLASGILLRIHAGASNWLMFAALGAALGLGYLTKAAMFPLAFVFLLINLFSFGKLRKAIPRAALALLVFLLAASPLIIAISKSKGRLTFGESARLSYVWYVNLRWLSPNHPLLWQEDVPGLGALSHPARKIFAEPAIYEFATPVGGAYPMWYDPSYWFEGFTPHFDLSGQARRLAESAKVYYEMFFHHVECGLLVGLLALYLVGYGRRLRARDLARHWRILAPALAAIGMYGLVWAEPRHIAPFIALFWLGLWAGVRLPDSQEFRRLMACVVIAAAAVTTTVTVVSSAGEAASTARALIKGEDASANTPWQVAEGLRRMGIQPGDKVASLGLNFHVYWARLARAQVVAEALDPAGFWAASDEVRSRAIEALAKTGAKVIVTGNVPSHALIGGWERIADTDFHVYDLRKSLAGGN